MSVLVLIEPGEELSLQAVSLAREVGGPVHAFSVTDDPSVGAYGVQTLHVPDDERLSATERPFSPVAIGRPSAYATRMPTW